MKVLSLVCRIVLFPVSLLLRMVAAFLLFMSEKCADRLHIFSLIMFLLTAAAYAQYFFGWPLVSVGVAAKGVLYFAVFTTIFAYLISPKGMPMLGIPLVEKLKELNDMIKNI